MELSSSVCSTDIGLKLKEHPLDIKTEVPDICDTIKDTILHTEFELIDVKYEDLSTSGFHAIDKNHAKLLKPFAKNQNKMDTRQDKQRDLMRRRRDEIRNDPEKYERIKRLEKERYHRRKREGKIKLVGELSIEEQNEMRRKWRLKQRKYYYAKKHTHMHKEDLFIEQCCERSEIMRRKGDETKNDNVACEQKKVETKTKKEKESKKKRMRSQNCKDVKKHNLKLNTAHKGDIDGVKAVTEIINGDSAIVETIIEKPTSKTYLDIEIAPTENVNKYLYSVNQADILQNKMDIRRRKQRELMRRRRNEIKNDPEKYEPNKELERERYYRRKQEGKVRSVGQLSIEEQNELRRKWRLRKKKSYDAKKHAPRQLSIEEQSENSRELERKRKQRDIMRRRRDEIRNDPEKYEQSKKLEKERYYRRKREGKVKLIGQLDIEEQNEMRRKWRLRQRKSYNARKHKPSLSPALKEAPRIEQWRETMRRKINDTKNDPIIYEQRQEVEIKTIKRNQLRQKRKRSQKCNDPENSLQSDTEILDSDLDVVENVPEYTAPNKIIFVDLTPAENISKDLYSVAQVDLVSESEKESKRLRNKWDKVENNPDKQHTMKPLTDRSIMELEEVGKHNLRSYSAKKNNLRVNSAHVSNIYDRQDLMESAVAPVDIINLDNEDPLLLPTEDANLDPFQMDSLEDVLAQQEAQIKNLFKMINEDNDSNRIANRNVMDPAEMQSVDNDVVLSDSEDVDNMDPNNETALILSNMGKAGVKPGDEGLMEIKRRIKKAQRQKAFMRRKRANIKKDPEKYEEAKRRERERYYKRKSEGKIESRSKKKRGKSK